MTRVFAVLLAALLTVLGCTAATATPDPGEDPVRAKEYWLDQYGITDAWKTTQGDGVRIAVIDTGVAKVSELKGTVVGGTDVSGAGTPDGRTPVGVLDINHGTYVASLAAGRGTGKDTGLIGVAPKADILSISIGFGAASQVPFSEQIVKAMHWAVDHGAKVINLSFTTNTLDWDESWDEAFLYAFEHDVVVVVAAGNRGSGTGQVGAPATIPGVLTVGGVDPKGRVSVEASTQGITIGVVAPSEDLLGITAEGELGWWKGTSGAAPIVSGIVALVRAAHPDLDANDVIERVIKTAHAPKSVTKLPSPLYGYGLVDAEAAVTAHVPHVTENPMGNLKEWVRLYRRAHAEPQPKPSSSPVAVPPLPPSTAVDTHGSALLPGRDRVLYGSIPLMAATLPAILVALGVTVAARRIRSARSSRTPRRQNH